MFIPTDVPVYGVEISRIAPFVFGAITNLTVDVAVSVVDKGWNIDAQGTHSGVQGTGLWKIGMWASASSDGIGSKIGFISQVNRLLCYLFYLQGHCWTSRGNNWVLLPIDKYSVLLP